MYVHRHMCQYPRMCSPVNTADYPNSNIYLYGLYRSFSGLSGLGSRWARGHGDQKFEPPNSYLRANSPQPRGWPWQVAYDYYFSEHKPALYCRKNFVVKSLWWPMAYLIWKLSSCLSALWMIVLTNQSLSYNTFSDNSDFQMIPLIITIKIKILSTRRRKITKKDIKDIYKNQLAVRRIG